MYILSRFPFTGVVLMLSSIALVICQQLLGGGQLYSLWGNWLIAGLCAWGIRDVVLRMRLSVSSECRALVISWPMMSLSLNFADLYFPGDVEPWRALLQLLSMLLVVMLLLSTWQQRAAIVRYMTVGIVIALQSLLMPSTLLWLLLVPLALYEMRCWTSRNFWSVPTGALFALWVVWSGTYLFDSPEAAASIFEIYRPLLHPVFLPPIQPIDMWQGLFLGLTALLVVVYSVASLLLNVGQSIRAHDSVALVSLVALVLVVFTVFDLPNLPHYVNLLTLLLCVQLSIHQSNVHDATGEWWILLVILVSTALTALPLILDSKVSFLNF